ncbi:hypothetical protein EGW08_022751 [Elysia chlorotica]|uniref:Uncharacterized protein n=1 Tax=Elysia chlorotica TaxID=188477 RepID=A0A3S0Z4Y3_ELYCH|nr:hypothetical protein EGW08_022751 [Elysia chlorotica]
MAFRCSTCGYCCTTLHAGNRHLARSCPGVRVPVEAPHDVGPTELRDDGTLVLQWPATRLDQYLARRHATQMGRRLWHCNKCNKTMTGLETREHTCEGTRKPRTLRGPTRQSRGPPALAGEPSQPRRSLASDTEDEQTPPRDGATRQSRRPAAKRQTPPTRPATPRQPTPAHVAPTGGDEDQDHSHADLGEDLNTSSLPLTPIRMDPRSPEPAAPSDNTSTTLSPIEQEHYLFNISGDSEEGAFIKQEPGAGPINISDFVANVTTAGDDISQHQNSPATPRTMASEDTSHTSSPPTNSPPAASPSSPHEMTAEGEGPTTNTTHEDQPVVAEIHSIWDLPEDGQPPSTPVLPTSPDLFLDDVDNGDIPQPGWHARTPGTPGMLPP